jgi:mediator of replication checkpoint protein 1
MSTPPSPSLLASEPPTPRAKVQALLAQFSDSDSDRQSDAALRKASPKKTTAQQSPTLSEEDESEDDDVPVQRKSRMALRLEAGSSNHTTEDQRGSEALLVPEMPTPIESEEDESSDALARPEPRRRLLTKRKSNATPVFTSPLRSAPSPASSLNQLRSSGGLSDQTEPVQEDEDANTETSEPEASGINPRFKALVEKQRKLRAEKDEAERAKRAAREVSEEASEPKRQRGSSPGDDSHESSDGSDAEAAQKIAKSSKPTRKASKKAVEEMKRETQRMSRNMQLAHQAQVKKRFTKDSFFARFNRTPIVEESQNEPQIASSRTASPERNSDNEHSQRHTTPPTSPVEETRSNKPQSAGDTQTDEQLTGLGVVLEAPALADIGLEPQIDHNKGKGKLGEKPKILETQMTRAVLVGDPTMEPASTDLSKKQSRLCQIAELLRQNRAASTVADDDDLDIISSRGDLRKYAVFEKLPKRKAKETPSHLALRALAQIELSDRKKSGKTASEVQADLRHRMREQARQVQRERIEELRAKGIVFQTAEERERDQQEIEDIVERARQEAAEISKREKEAAKKDGTFVKDSLDDDSDDEDDEFVMEDDEPVNSEDDESEDGTEVDEDAEAKEEAGLFDDQADEAGSDEESQHESEGEVEEDSAEVAEVEQHLQTPAPRRARNMRVLSDDEDDAAQNDSPNLPQPTKTPQSLLRSTRKQIPGLQMSDDTPLGLTQAFAATMADSQTQEETAANDTVDYVADLPSPGLSIVPRLNRLDSLDIVSESQPASQTQPLDISLSFAQSHVVPESPSLNRRAADVQATPSQAPFEPTQDEGYMYSPFTGNRFSETPQAGPHSTVDTVPLHAVEASPVVQRRNRLRRGRAASFASTADEIPPTGPSAFEVMRRAAKRADEPFDKTKSNARAVVDEAAEESDDEYAGLGGASDEENANDVENDDDRRMIDHDANVGEGDEAALAGYHADRERKADEAGVSKLYQDITTGRLRRRRGANDELDLSDEEDAAARKREAKRREFARMRRELLKDEAVGKIAEDKKKEAFLRSLEDRQVLSDDEDFNGPETQDQSQSQQQTQPQDPAAAATHSESTGNKRKRVLEATSEDQLNRPPPALRRNNGNKKPATLSEIRENLSFLVDEADSQGPKIDLGLSDSEEEPEAYVDLDRHAREAEADENAEDEDGEGLGDFIVDDESPADNTETFKKPSLPASLSNEGLRDRSSAFASRRTTSKVVNRLSLLRQSSSSAASTKMAYSTSSLSSTFTVPTLLRRATTNSSLSSISSGEGMSATGVTVAMASKTERGHVSEEKAFVRKGNSGRRNAVNFQAGERPEGKMSSRSGVNKKGLGGAGGSKKKGGLLGDLLGRGDTWG